MCSLSYRTIALAAVLVSLAACSGPSGSLNDRLSAKAARPAGDTIEIPAPLGLPPVPIPPDNSPTAETVALGKKLYFSTALSADGSLSCATCHDPKIGFADGRRVSTGIHRRQGTRNAPSVLNAAYNKLQFWDGRADSLEAQVSGPMLNSLEMGHTLEGVEEGCANDAELRLLFEQAFGPGPPTIGKIMKAIASFERTLISGNSPVDRFLFAGQKDALSPGAQRGLTVFRDRAKGNCAACHTIQEKYALFTDHLFHNLGVGLSPEGEITDMGRYIQTHRNGEQGAFRTPSLRNVALTAPYMHDGSLKTLKDVVDFYVGGGSSNPYLDSRIKPLTHLTRQERSDLVVFLESLTGDLPNTGEVNTQ
jgi:cytochrome c peroxidase